MDLLQIPTLDLNHEGNVVYNTPDNTFSSTRSLVWPEFSIYRSLTALNPQNSKRSLKYFIYPKLYQAQVEEAIFLNYNDEILVNFNPSTARRHIYFQFFAMSPGIVRVTIGPHVWTKNVSDNEVQKFLQALVQINDASANQARIVSQSMPIYLTKLSLNQVERGGRAPIAVAADSQLWEIPKHKLEAESLDPDVQENKRVVGPESLALGYNLVWVQMPPLPQLLESPFSPQSKALAPHIHGFTNEAAGLITSGDAQMDGDHLFRRTLLGQGAHWPKDTLIHALEQEGAYNIVGKFRSFGYRTGLVAWPTALHFPKNLASRPIPPLEGRWLEESDERLASMRREIDQMGVEASGLDAIFKSTSNTAISPLSDGDFNPLSQLLGDLAQDNSGIPDWKSQTMAILHPGPMYGARAAQNFTNMVKEMAPSRFFIQLGLDPIRKDRPALTDFFKVVGTYGVSAIPFSKTGMKKTQQFSQVALADKTLAHILQSLQAHYVAHRTIVALYLPPGDENPGHVWIKIPGVKPKPFSEIKSKGIDLDKIVDGLMVLMGLPKEATPLGKDHNLDHPQQVVGEGRWNNKLPIKMKHYHVHMLASPHPQSPCTPIHWQAHTPMGQVESERAVDAQPHKGLISFFPCEADVLTHVKWTQRQDDSNTDGAFETPPPPDALQKALGGQIFVDPGPTLPAIFLFGPRKIRLGHLIFSLHTLPSLPNYFQRDPAQGVLMDESQLRALARHSGKPVFHFWIEKAY